jgi:hypothetical protein
MNLLLFDGLQSTNDNPDVPKIMDIVVVASITKNEGREILSQMHLL